MMICDEAQILEFENAEGMTIIDPEKDHYCKDCDEYKSLNDFYIVTRKGQKHIDYCCKKCRSETHKLYYLKNSEKLKKQSSEYYRKNKEKHREWSRQYLKKNPDIVRYSSQKLYAKENGIPFKMTRKDYVELMKGEVRCFATGKKLSFTKHRNAFVSRVRMNKPYSPENMEIVNKKNFYDKLTDHNFNLREDEYE